MFTASRFIAIDNEPKHLEAITNAFNQLGVSCLGMLYEPGNPFKKDHFAGLRALILDLHLTSGTKQTDDKQHYSLIAGLLEDNIAATAGPYVIVLWTEYPAKAEELIAYLDERLEVHARPLTVIPLSKDPYLFLDRTESKYGSVRDPAALRDELTKKIMENPQVSAMLTWELDVMKAASATLNSILALVPADKRTSAEFPKALDLLLSRLAAAAVGAKNVKTDVRAAINAVLVPVLTDRLHAMSDTLGNNAWKKAVTKAGRRFEELSPAAAGALNQMLHIEIVAAPAEAWGAVVEYPAGWRRGAKTRNTFGDTLTDVIDKEFKIPKGDIGKCRPVLVRVGAVCDYAQKKNGPIPYVLGIEKPFVIEPHSDQPASLWTSPVFVRDEEAFVLQTSSRYLISVPPVRVTEFKVNYRLREPLLMELVTRLSTYLARPGIISVSRSGLAYPSPAKPELETIAVAAASVAQATPDVPPAPAPMKARPKAATAKSRQL